MVYILLGIILAVGVHVFYVFAAIHNFHRSLVLLFLMVVVYLYCFYKLIAGPYYTKNEQVINQKVTRTGDVVNRKVFGFPLLQSYVLKN